MHHVQLTQKTPGTTYCIVVLSLDDLDIIRTSAGHDTAQVAIRNLRISIDKHFGAIGGFSTRRRSNEFVTILPYSDLTEAESILKDFVKDFQERGIHDIWAGARGQTSLAGCFEFAVLAGIAQGQPDADIDSLIDAAKSQQKEIARLRCDGRR
jgi:phospholipid/cholesterol/gamma-HCH transport system ATP-binding protein